VKLKFTLDEQEEMVAEMERLRERADAILRGPFWYRSSRAGQSEYASLVGQASCIWFLLEKAGLVSGRFLRVGE
jgi:hypothetical protein